MNKYPLIGVSILVVILFILGSLGNVVGYQTCQKSIPEVVSLGINNEISNEPWEKTIYRLCDIQSGDVRHKNFNGWFFGSPVNHPEYGFCHFGVGSFELDLQRDYFTDNNETTLQISHLIKNDFNDTYIRIKVNLFVGYYQPTGGLGDGTLSGYALRVKILYKGDIPNIEKIEQRRKSNG
ncbi:MAG: hypothetical protein IMZ58_10585 [Thermoplasmata archaeon]|nr:hypothetical protein [Thermoplasmata archaeon]